MPAEINLDELLAEYARLGATSQPGAMTVAQLVRASGHSDDVIRRVLALAKADGILRVCKVADMTLDGRPCRKPAYWIERPKKGKKG